MELDTGRAPRFAAGPARGVEHAVSSYRAPRWLPGGHAQTLYAALLAPRPRVGYSRVRWDTPDGDFVDIDWIAPTAGSGRPLVALFHGLEGCSASHYAYALMAHLQALGWDGVVVHFRGCSGVANRLPRAYHSGDTVELDWMLRRLSAATDGPLYAVGVSLGGNVLLKWLGEHGARASGVLSGAAAVSAPLDLMAAGDALGRGFNRIYTQAFLTTLKRKSRALLERHPDLFDGRRVRSARTLREFDDLVTAPLHGFRNTDDYWTRASSKPWLTSIAIPTLVLNARNDPFMPAAALPDPGSLPDAVRAEFPDEGGHAGFVTGAFPGRLDWLPRRIIGFFRERARIGVPAAERAGLQAAPYNPSSIPTGPS